MKNVLSILIGITLNLHIAFDNMDILMILTLLIQEHGLILHFLKSSISLFNVFFNFPHRDLPHLQLHLFPEISFSLFIFII